jgi:hypothetical protein
MFDIMTNDNIIKNNNNVIINPEYIEKKRFHGSLTRGIYSNILYALQNYTFSKFIILSSRTIFYKTMNITNLDKIQKTETTIKPDDEQLHTQTWHWPNFRHNNCKLFHYFKDKLLTKTCHEGLVFDYQNCNTIKTFLENNLEIKENLFTFNSCAEEFALQTICINFDKYFYYIGNNLIIYKEGDVNPSIQPSFVYKVEKPHVDTFMNVNYFDFNMTYILYIIYILYILYIL